MKVTHPSYPQHYVQPKASNAPHIMSIRNVCLFGDTPPNKQKKSWKQSFLDGYQKFLNWIKNILSKIKEFFCKPASSKVEILKAEPKNNYTTIKTKSASTAEAELIKITAEIEKFKSGKNIFTPEVQDLYIKTIKRIIQEGGEGKTFKDLNEKEKRVSLLFIESMMNSDSSDLAFKLVNILKVPEHLINS